MIYAFLAFVTAVCALGQPVTVGILLESGELVPAGTYKAGEWTGAKPELTKTSISIPKVWGASGDEFHGLVVHITAPPASRAIRYGYVTDFPRRPVFDEFFPAVVGVVTSPSIPVVMFRDVSDDLSEQDKMKTFLGQQIDLQLNSLVKKYRLHPVKVVKTEPALISRSEAAISASTYYHVHHESKVYDEMMCQPNCAENDYFVVRFDAWLTETAAGPRDPVIVSTQADIDPVFRQGRTVTRPVGAVMFGGAWFVVAHEHLNDSKRVLVLKLSPGPVRVLTENNWFYN